MLKRRRTGEAQSEFRSQARKAEPDSGGVEFTARDRRTQYKP
jgi:hypothetical protein